MPTASSSSARASPTSGSASARRGVAEPTGVGDAFRSGFLAATAWGLGLERPARWARTLATLVVETVGTQEYAFPRRRFTERIAEAYGDDAAAEVRAHLG